MLESYEEPSAGDELTAEMALNQQDREWIRTTIANALNEHSQSKLAQFKSWSPLGAVIGLAIFALTQWNGYTIFKIHTEDRLGSIEATLLTIQASQNPKKVLNQVAKLQPPAFDKALPALRKVAEQPASEVTPSQATLREIADKLRHTNEGAPDYWPTVLQFISFASAGFSPATPPSKATPDLTIENNTGLFNLGLITSKVVRIDGGDIGPVRFQNCRIILTGKPTRMTNVTFLNCVFELPVTSEPNQFVQQIGRQLLSLGTQQAVLSVS